MPPSADHRSAAARGQPDVAALLRAHAPALRAAFAAGERTWPQIALPYATYAERFVRRILQRAGGDAGSAASSAGETLARAAGADVFLAIACDERVPGAWERLTEHFRPRLLDVARRQRLSAAEAEDLVEDLLGDLLARTPRGDARTGIGSFDGTGSLFGWLSAILLRRLVDRRRAPGARRQKGAGAPEPASDDTPLDSAIDGETVGELRDVLRGVWSRLHDQEALALLFRYRDGLPQNRIAGLLGVSESRISRVMAAAVGKLRAALEAPLAAPGTPAPGRLWRLLHDVVAERLQESDPSDDHVRGGDLAQERRT